MDQCFGGLRFISVQCRNGQTVALFLFETTGFKGSDIFEVPTSRSLVRLMTHVLHRPSLGGDDVVQVRAIVDDTRVIKIGHFTQNVWVNNQYTAPPENS